MNDDDRCLPRADVGLNITYSRKQGSHQWGGYGAIYLKMVMGPGFALVLELYRFAEGCVCHAHEMVKGSEREPRSLWPLSSSSSEQAMGLAWF